MLLRYDGDDDDDDNDNDNENNNAWHDDNDNNNRANILTVSHKIQECSKQIPSKFEPSVDHAWSEMAELP